MTRYGALPTREQSIAQRHVAAGTPDNPRFDIDLAVDSDKYWELLGIALGQPIPVDLVDLPRAARHIRSRIEAEGRWLYGHE